MTEQTMPEVEGECFGLPTYKEHIRSPRQDPQDRLQELFGEAAVGAYQAGFIQLFRWFASTEQGWRFEVYLAEDGFRVGGGIQTIPLDKPAYRLAQVILDWCENACWRECAQARGEIEYPFPEAGEPSCLPIFTPCLPAFLVGEDCGGGE